MAIDFARQCAFPQDLEAAAAALEQQLGDALTAALAQIPVIEAAGAGIQPIIDEANQTIDQLLAIAAINGSPLVSGIAMEKYLGIPKDNPTINDDEDQVFLAGVPFFDGVIYTIPTVPVIPKPLVNVLTQDTPKPLSTGATYLRLAYHRVPPGNTPVWLTLQKDGSGVLRLQTSITKANPDGSVSIIHPEDNLDIDTTGMNLTQMVNVILSKGHYTASIENAGGVFLVSDLDQVSTGDGINLLSGPFGFTATLPAKNYTNNIENLRRLYFAAGRDLGRTQDFESLLVSPGLTSFQLLNELVLNIIAAPTGPAAEDVVLANIQAQLQAPFLTADDLTKLDDGRYLVLTEAFIGKDDAVPNGSVAVSSFFHYKQVDNSPQVSNKYHGLGYSGDSLSAILSGQDLEAQNPNLVNRLLTSTTTLSVPEFSGSLGTQPAVNLLITKVQFFIDRLLGAVKVSGLPAFQAIVQDAIAFKSTLINALQQLIQQHMEIIAVTRFTSTIALQNDTLERLKELHSSTQITRLLEKRKLITSVDFDATVNDKIQLIKSLGKAGTSTIATSSNFFDSLTAKTSNDKVLLDMLGFLQQALDTLPALVVVNAPTGVPNITTAAQAAAVLQKCLGYLQKYSGAAPVQDVPVKSIGSTILPNAVQQGIESQGSPATTLLETLNPIKSFNEDGLMKDMEDLILTFPFPELLIKALQAVINLINKLMLLAENAITSIVGGLNATVLPLKKKIDALMTKYGALTGGGSFGNSILKCSISFELGINFALADILLALINNLGAIAQGFLSKIIGLVNDILNKIICIPINLINGLIGAVSALVPPFCTVPKFSLPPELEAALAELAAIGGAKSLIMQTMNTDLLKVKAAVNFGPLQGAQFKVGAACNGPNSALFAAAAGLNLLGASFGTPSPAPLSSFGQPASASSIISVAKSTFT